jgi:hypothetical protein
MALSAIRLRVADHVLVYVSSAKSAAEAWQILRDTYEPSGAIGIVLVRRKFFRAECPEGGDIEEHIRLLRSYQTELATLGQKIEEADFSMTLLTSLPDSWNAFTSTVDPTEPVLKESAKLISKILLEDRRIKAGNGNDDTALAAKSRSQKSRKNVTCYKCGKKGHFKSDCPEKDTEWKGRGGKGKKDGEKANMAKSSVDEDYVFASDDIVLATSHQIWLADSGATSHVCRNTEFLSDYSACSGSITGLSGQKITSLGRGKIQLNCNVGNEVKQVTLTDVVHAPEALNNLISLS